MSDFGSGIAANILPVLLEKLRTGRFMCKYRIKAGHSVKVGGGWQPEIWRTSNKGNIMCGFAPFHVTSGLPLAGATRREPEPDTGGGQGGGAGQFAGGHSAGAAGGANAAG